MWTSEAQRQIVDSQLAQLDRHVARIKGSMPTEDDAAVSAARPLLALGILSTPEDAKRRECVRPTLRTALTDVGDRGYPLVHRFVIGGRSLASGAHTSLRAEQRTHGDLALLPRASDGRKSHLARKVVDWFAWALNRWPTAAFFGKADMDTLLVWERAQRHLHSLAPRARDGGAIYLGYFEWTSFQPTVPRVCGCCAGSEKHGRKIQDDPQAHFGPCFRKAATATTERETTHGPFPFAQGGFYALSAALVDKAQWTRLSMLELVSAPKAGGGSAGLPERLGASEDILVGYLVSRFQARARAHNSTLEIVRLSEVGAYAHDFASEFGPGRVHFHMRHTICPSSVPQAGGAREASSSAQVGNLSVGDLTTGTLSYGNSPEVVSPASVVLHRVRTCEQRRRAWALAASWTAKLRAWGEPECVYVGARKQSTGTVEDGRLSYSWAHGWG